MLQDFSLSKDLEVALENQLNMTEQQLADHRMRWCRRWLKRASELDNEEKQDWAQRPLHIRQNTSSKRLLLTAEILKDIGYEDLAVVDLLRRGSSLVGEIGALPSVQVLVQALHVHHEATGCWRQQAQPSHSEDDHVVW